MHPTTLLQVTKPRKEEEMVGLVYKLETEVPLKESADKMLKADALQVPKVSRGWIQNVKLHEGDWETHGSIRIWDYTVGGKAGVFKEKVAFDDENFSTTLVGVEGNIFEIYKSLQATYHFIPDGSGCKARLSIIYEKLRDDSPPPEIYIDLMSGLTQDIEAHLLKP